MKDPQMTLYTTFDEPYPFVPKGSDRSLLIYPALVKDYFLFSHFSDILLIDKNNIPDKDVKNKAKTIQMSYLDYIVSNDSADNSYVLYLYGVLSIVMRKTDIEFEVGYSSRKRALIKIDGIFIDGSDFETLRHVICEQNLLELPNEKISFELRNKMREAEELRAKSKNSKPASLEDYIVALSISTGISVENIYNMTVRKFRKSLERVDHKLHYELFMGASLSGLVEFKDKNTVKHWLADLSKDEMKGLMPYDEFENKISPVS